MSWSNTQRSARLAAVGILTALTVWGCSTAAQDAQRRMEFVDSHPGISELMAQAILDEEILVGMDDSMVTASWGRPARIEVGELEGEPMELWIYGNVWNGEPLKHLFFDNENTLVKFEIRNALMVSPGEVVSKPNPAALTKEQRAVVKDSP